MKLVVLDLTCTSGTELFSEAAAEPLRFLMAQGLYGSLEGEMLWPMLKPHFATAILAEYRGDVRELQTLLSATKGDEQCYVHVRIAPKAAVALVWLEQILEALPDELDDGDALAIVASSPENRAFLVVTASSPWAGRVDAATADLALTLLALLGVPRPDGLAGRALVTASAPVAYDDDEAALRERFRGLGYVP